MNENEGDFVGKVFILTNKASEFTFDDDLMYGMCDLAGLPPVESNDQVTRELAELYRDKILVALDKGDTILLDYNILSAKTVGAILRKASDPLIAQWVAITFFHNDSELSKVKEKPNLLDNKAALMKSMTEFPFIRKIEIPYGFKFTSGYFMDLMEVLAE